MYCPTVENGYDNDHMNKIVDNYKPGQRNQLKDDDKFQNILLILWIPGLSTKLKKPFKNAGINQGDMTFKSISICLMQKEQIINQPTVNIWHL